MVRMEGVGLQYDRAGRPGTEALRDLTFVIEEGGFRWLLGPSGAGKTSLLRLLYLAVRPTSGRLTILDTEVTNARRGVIDGVLACSHDFALSCRHDAVVLHLSASGRFGL